MESQDWPTQQHDIALAKEILLNHRNHDGKTTELNFKEVSITEEGTSTEKHPEWVLDLAHAFESRYGKKQGWTITTRVITQLMIDDEQVH